MRGFGLVGAAALLAACSDAGAPRGGDAAASAEPEVPVQDIDPDAYFPFDPRIAYIYELVQESQTLDATERTEKELVRHFAGDRELDGEIYAFFQGADVSPDAGNYIGVDDFGVYVIAEVWPARDYFYRFETRQYLLALAAPVEWSEETPSLLAANQAIEIDCRQEFSGEPLTIPYGTFENPLAVECRARRTAPFPGVNDVRFLATGYYAEGVGYLGGEYDETMVYSSGATVSARGSLRLTDIRERD